MNREGKENSRLKSQSSTIAIVLGVVVFVGIVMFMLTMPLSEQNLKQAEALHMNRFTSNLLISLTNMDTECGKMSDVMKGAYFGNPACTGRCNCITFFKKRVPGYMSVILNETGYTNLKYLIVLKSDQHAENIELGDSTANSRGSWEANTRTSWRGSDLEIKIYIAES